MLGRDNPICCSRSSCQREGWHAPLGITPNSETLELLPIKRGWSLKLPTISYNRVLLANGFGGRIARFANPGF